MKNINHYQHVSCVICHRYFTKVGSLAQHACYTAQNRALNKEKISIINKKNAFLSGLKKWQKY